MARPRRRRPANTSTAPEVLATAIGQQPLSSPVRIPKAVVRAQRLSALIPGLRASRRFLPVFPVNAYITIALATRGEVPCIAD